MPIVHSRRTRAHVAAIPMACHVRQVGIDHTVDMVDVTTMCVNAREYLEGMETGTFSFAGLLDNTVTQLWTPLNALRQNGLENPISVAPSGYAIGEQVWLAEGELMSLEYASPLTDAVTFGAGFQVTGRPDLGVSLHDVVAAETAGGNSTSVDNTAGTTNGGAAILHVSAFTGTSITVKVQHSTNNSTWVDLVTFTAATAAGAQHIEVAAGTTVNRYLRSIWTGTFTSATFAVGFARR